MLKAARRALLRFKMPRYLEDGECIDRFAVDEVALHSALLKFLGGQDRVRIGFGDVEVETKHYLRPMREYKTSSDVNYNLCISGNEATA